MTSKLEQYFPVELSPWLILIEHPNRSSQSSFMKGSLLSEVEPGLRRARKDPRPGMSALCRANPRVPAMEGR